MLKQRILTALVLIPVALWGFFGLEGADFALFAGCMVVLGGWEWARLAGYESQGIRCAYALLIALLAAGLYQLPGLALWVIGLSGIWWLLATVWVLGYPGSARYWQSSRRRLLIGGLLLLPPWQALVLIKQLPSGDLLILAVMLLVWGADIGAFFAGRRFGRHKLAPAVSPGKSWEGCWGGLLLCLSGVLVTAAVQAWPVAWLPGILLGALVVVAASVVGDLTESMFKRNAGLKDSSQLLPGHGGVLDRIDSLTAALPVFVIALWLAGRV